MLVRPTMRPHTTRPPFLVLPDPMTVARIPSPAAAVLLINGPVARCSAAYGLRNAAKARGEDVKAHDVTITGCWGEVIGATWWDPARDLDTPAMLGAWTPDRPAEWGDMVVSELCAEGLTLEAIGASYNAIVDRLLAMTTVPATEAKERADFSEPPPEPPRG